jgi:DNA-binding CsgD family transcriptional regulator
MRGKHKTISFVILSTAYLSLLLSFLLFEILSEPLFPLPSAVFPPLLFLPLAAAAVVVLEKRRRNKQIRPESSYRSFARQFKNPVFIVDRNYQVVTANRAAEKLLEINKGVVRKSGNSAPLPSLLDAAGMDAKMMPSIPAADSAGMSFELPFGRPDGSARLRMSVSPVSLSGAAETAAFSVQMAADDFALLCSSRKYGLTGRETEIVSLLMKGLSNKGIAEELYISLATVKTHLHNIYEKTGTGSRNRLVECVRSCEPELD